MNDWIEQARTTPHEVAQDVNAPPHVLFLLARDYPTVVATNPSWALLLIDSLVHDQLTTYSRSPAWKGVVRLLRTPELGSRLATYLTGGSSLHHAILALTSPFLSRALLERVWERIHADPLNALSSLTDITEYIPAANAPDDLLVSNEANLRNIGFIFVRAGWGSDELHAQWVDGLTDEDRTTPITATWPTLSAENAERLYHQATTLLNNARNENQAQRAVLALQALTSTPNTPSHVMEALVPLVLDPPRDEYGNALFDLTMERAVAFHPNLPEGSFAHPMKPLGKAVFLERPDVTEEFARKWLPLTPSASLATAARTGPGWLARHILTTHGWPDVVRANAFINPRAGTDTTIVPPGLEKEIAGLPPTPEDVALRLAQHQDPEVRVALAWHSLFPRVHQVLAEDPEREVRHAVASRQYARTPTLAQLTQDPDEKVRNAAWNTTTDYFLPYADP